MKTDLRKYTAAPVRSFFLMVSVVCLALSIAKPTLGFETRLWAVQGLPNDIDGSEFLVLPSNPDAAAQILEHKLENYGYALARVRASGDRLIVRLGKIVDIDVEAIDPAVRSAVRRHLDVLLGTSPTTERLSEVITLINDIHGFSGSISMQSMNEDGDHKVVAAGDLQRQSGVLSVRNTPAKEFKSREASLHQEFYSLLMSGDILRFDVTGIDTDEGSEAIAFEFSHEVPINNIGTVVETRLSHFDATSENQFEPGQSSDANTTAGAFVIAHAFDRKVDIADYVFAEFNYRTESTTGFDDQNYAVMRTVFVETQHFDQGTNFTWGLGLSLGREVSNSTSPYGIVRGGFGFLFWLPQISETADVRIENSWQIGTDNVPGFEFMSFGGINRQRGFEAFEYAGSHGADLTIELADTFQPWADNGPIVSPYVFADATFLANQSSVASDGRPENNTLVSLGVGSKVSFLNGVSLIAWLAAPMYDEEQPDRERGPQFYLQAQYSW